MLGGQALLIVFVLSIGAGIIGAMAGIGGGLIIVPLLSIVFHVPVKEAIATSIVTVIATSSAGGSVYVDKGLTNVRLGMTLEMATAAGGILGGLTDIILPVRAVEFIFAVALIILSGWQAYSTRYPPRAAPPTHDLGVLGARFRDAAVGRTESYGVRRLPIGLALSFVAGNLSGLLGVGGGVVKVPAMTIGMGVPAKPAVATSNFMIGVTAVASALIFYANGQVNPLITAPTVLGVLAGSLAGTAIAGRMKARALLYILVFVLFAAAIEFAIKALG